MPVRLNSATAFLRNGFSAGSSYVSLQNVLNPGWDRCSFARWGTHSHPTFYVDVLRVRCSSLSLRQNTLRYFDLKYACRPMSSKAGFVALAHSCSLTDKCPTVLLLGAYQIGKFPVAHTDRYYIPKLRARLNFNWLFSGKKQWNG